MTGKQDIVSVTIDPEVVDPDDVEMLQDLVVAAVGDALANARRTRPRRRWPVSPVACASPASRASDLPASSSGRPSARMSQLIEPVARLIESFSRLPGIGPKTAQRLTYHLLRAPEIGGPRAWPRPSSPFATTSSSASAATTSAPGRCVPICS